MKELKITLQTMENKNYVVIIDVNGHTDLSTFNYEHTNDNHTSIAMFNFTQEDLINLRNQINKAIK